MNKKDRFLKEFAAAFREVKKAEKGEIKLQYADDMIKELKAKHGGKRTGAGRKTEDKKTYTIRVTASEKEMIHKMRRDKPILSTQPGSGL